MAETSAIEWTDATWNCIRGCDKVSPGCKLCYAETFAERFRGVPGSAYEQGFDLRLVPGKMNEPLKWKNPKNIFVNSMSDMFHKDVPDDYIHQMVDVMLKANWHKYQCLTKRSERMRDMLNGSLANKVKDQKHIWWGVSVEDKRYGVPRIAHLQAADVPVRFLSVEPLLEDLGPLDLAGIHWVIVGGESGAGCRPMEATWAENVMDHCQLYKIPFFMKQWGGYPNKRGGDEAKIKGRIYHELPVV